ncbi:hypothetical protein GCM10009827_058680 [Dactylosporangium maewongense]|uniref:Integrase n=1 Tax=Dactylosporangium maewongense TaxID=634393 RepID=A0ABN2B688_9ACTN
MYRDHHGRERSAGTFTSKKRANKAWQKAETDLAAGKIGDPKRGRQKLARYVNVEWFPNHVLEATTRENTLAVPSCDRRRILPLRQERQPPRHAQAPRHLLRGGEVGTARRDTAGDLPW